MNTKLQLIVYHIDGNSPWTVLVITLGTERMCEHSGIFLVSLPYILFPVGARFSAPVQTGPGAHPASYTMGTGPLSRG
jgi:hypothetical protein